MLPPQVAQFYLSPREGVGEGNRLLYRAELVGMVRLHYVHARSKTDTWTTRAFLIPFAPNGRDANWSAVRPFDEDALDLLTEPLTPGAYDELPAIATNARSYADWNKELASYVYRESPLNLYHSASLKAWSLDGEREGEFRGRLVHQAREQRDAEVEKLKTTYERRFQTMQDRIRRAEDRRDRNAAQYSQQKMQTVMTVGQTLLGAMMGRKAASATNIGRAATAANRAQRTAGRREEIARSEQELEVQQQRLAELENEFQEAVDRLEQRFHADELEIESVVVAPRKSDISVRDFGLLWRPFRITASGIAEPLDRLPVPG